MAAAESAADAGTPDVAVAGMASASGAETTVIGSADLGIEVEAAHSLAVFSLEGWRILFFFLVKRERVKKSKGETVSMESRGGVIQVI